jgi:outer membrane lipoprotein-sorting protein
MKRFLIAAFALAAAGLWGITPDEIVAKMRDQNKHDSTQARIQADILEKGGTASERLIDEYSITKGGLRRVVAVFQKPASVKDTRFLIVENSGREDDRWIYLPTLRKVRRIAASEGGTSFIGEFTYDDLSIRDAGMDVHTLLREESLGGEGVYVVQSLPKDPSSSQYGKTVTFVSKEKWLPLRIELYDKRGSLLKVGEVQDSKQVQGAWSIMKLRMGNVQTGNSTTITYQILEYGKPIPEGVFTTRFLETGRP